MLTLSRQTRDNLLLISLPFFLTAVFIAIGYRILATSTPEARITPSSQIAQAEIITDADFVLTKPQTLLPETLNFYITQVPDKQIELDQIIQNAKNSGTNGLYLAIPVTVKEDMTLELTKVHETNLENITRWVKKTVSTAHQAGIHVMLAPTLNATTTIGDYQKFGASLRDFLPRWASLATEYDVTFLAPGITIGHPLYSNLTPAELSQLLDLAQNTIRKTYNGRIAAGFCCTETTQARPGGYTNLVMIPTPEFEQASLLPQARQLVSAYKMTQLWYFDRVAQQVYTLTLQ